MSELQWLSSHSLDFPSVQDALQDPNGLLAVGGDLSPARLVEAYRHGIFPWYEEGQPILWWSPDPRMVLFPDELHVSRSLGKVIRQNKFMLSCDRAFDRVINQCAAAREYSNGTWITPAMQAAYLQLHQQGIAHSIEAWYGDQLVGGLYGIALDDMFFGESMFHTMADASKVAFVSMVRQLSQLGYRLIDCQVSSAHLEQFGAREIPRADFVALLQILQDRDGFKDHWPLEFNEDGWK